MLIRQYIRCFATKFFKYEFQLFKPPGIDGFEKTTFFDAIFRSDVVTSETIFFKYSNEMTARVMFFSVPLEVFLQEADIIGKMTVKGVSSGTV